MKHESLEAVRERERERELHFSKESATILTSLIEIYRDKHSKAMCFRGS